MGRLLQHIQVLIWLALLVSLPEGATSNDPHEKQFQLRDVNYTVRYRLGRVEILDEGMASFYRTSRGVAAYGFSSDYPYESVVKYKGVFADGKSFQISYVTSQGSGYLFGIVCGVLLFLVFLVFFLCLPCCFCFSECCGQKPQAVKPSTSEIWVQAGIILFFCGLMGLIGVSTALQSHNHFVLAVDMLADTLKEAVGDLRTFITFFADNIMMLFNNFYTTRDAVNFHMDSIGLLLGNILRDNLENNSGLKVILSELLNFETVVEETITTINSVDYKIKKIDEEVQSLTADMQKTLADCSRVSGATCPRSVPNITVPPVDFTAANTTLTDLHSRNLTDEVDKAIVELDAIPAKVNASASNIIGDTKSTVLKEIDKLEPFKDTVISMRDKVLQKFKDGAFEKKIDNTKGHISGSSFHINFNGLTIFLLLVDLAAWFLLTSGAVLMAYGYRKNFVGTKDTSAKRKLRMASTRLAGFLMYSGVVVFVIVGWLWMVVVVLLFTIGGPVDVYFCRIVADNSFTIMDNLVEKHDLLGHHKTGSYLGTNLLNITNSTATFGRVLKACAADKTLFTAAHLEEHPRANFSQVLEQMIDNMNISQRIDTVNISVGTVNVLTPAVTTYLNESASLMTAIPFAQINSSLSGFDIDDKVKPFVNTLPEPLKDAAVTSMKPRLDNINNYKSKILTDMTELKEKLSKLSASVDHVTNHTRTAQDRIPSVLLLSTRQAAMEFSDNLKSVIMKFVNKSKDDVTNNFGKCKPLYNIYHAVLVDSICGNFVNALNGFWFALGWLHFVMLFAIIFAIRLNKMVPLPPKDGPRQKSVADSAKSRSDPPTAAGTPSMPASRVSSPDAEFSTIPLLNQDTMLAPVPKRPRYARAGSIPSGSPRQSLTPVSPWQHTTGVSLWQQPPTSAELRQALPSAEARQPFPSAELRQSFPSAEARHPFPSAELRQSFPSAEPRQSFPSAEPRQSFPSAEPRQSFPSAEPRQSFPSAEPRQSEASPEPRQAQSPEPRQARDFAVPRFSPMFSTRIPQGYVKARPPVYIPIQEPQQPTSYYSPPNPSSQPKSSSPKPSSPGTPKKPPWRW